MWRAERNSFSGEAVIERCELADSFMLVPKSKSSGFIDEGGNNI